MLFKDEDIKGCIFQGLRSEHLIHLASKTLLGLLYDDPNKISGVECVLRQSQWYQYRKCAIVGGMITNNNTEDMDMNMKNRSFRRLAGVQGRIY